MKKSMEEILSWQEHVESSARTYPRRIPLVLHRAKGVWVTDINGREYIDCLAGAGALPLGHNHPELVRVMKDLLDQEAPLTTLDLMTLTKMQFFEELLGILPSPWSENVRVQFCGPTGADGIEAAIKLAKTSTGNRSVIAFHGAYHGMTHGTLALTGSLAAKNPVANLMSEVHFFPYPFSYRCPFGLGGEKGDKVAATYFEKILKDPESGIPTPAAVVLEVIQGEGGVIPAPISWLQSLRKVTKELGIPLIIDEVQTGLGRTGAMFAFEKAGITPDMLVLSKALGGGLPISVMIYGKEWDHWAPGAHAGTFRGNQLAMAQGVQTMKILKEPSFLQEVRRKGDLLKNGLLSIQEKYPFIGDIRGEGFMLGVEFVHAEATGQQDALGSFPPYPELAKAVQAQSILRGLIIELGGRQSHVARFLPPLIITDEEIHLVVTIFEQALEESLRVFSLSQESRIYSRIGL